MTQGSDSWRVRGRWVALWSSSGAEVRLPGGLYRGRILVYLNDRGSLNLINELPLEDYLRGVVPREMGPELYDDLEGLKAQAVAARSYAVRNFGEFAAEGYDICATPRCQVYGGRGAEHPLSDRAVSETAGQILVHDGEPVDALYSSTCGGHTEDVGVVFPLKSEPYLRAVSCFEAGLTELAGDLAGGQPVSRGLDAAAVPGLRRPGRSGAGGSAAASRARGRPGPAHGCARAVESSGDHPVRGRLARSGARSRALRHRSRRLLRLRAAAARMDARGASPGRLPGSTRRARRPDRLRSDRHGDRAIATGAGDSAASRGSVGGTLCLALGRAS